MKKFTLHWVILSIVSIGYVACEAKINLDAIKDLLTVPSKEIVVEKDAYRGEGYKQVTISNSIKEIGANAFADNQFTSIIIPVSVEVIGNKAFAGNPLQKVILSSTLYGKLALKLRLEDIFGGQKIIYQDHDGKKLIPPPILPETTSITDTDEYKDKEYTFVYIPDSVINIEDGTFTGNTRLLTVALSSDLYIALKLRLEDIFGRQEITYQDHEGNILNNGANEENGIISSKGGIFIIDENEVLYIKEGVESIIAGTPENLKDGVIIHEKELKKIRGLYRHVVLPASIKRIPNFLGNNIETVTFLGENTLGYYQSPENETSFHVGSFIRNPLKAFIIPRGSWSKVIEGINVKGREYTKIEYMVERLSLTFCFARTNLTVKGKSCASKKEGSGRYTTEVTIHLQEANKRVGTITILPDTDTKKRQIALRIPEDITNITSVKTDWFHNMYLNTVRIPKAVTSIADGAFTTGNAKLTTVILLETLYDKLKEGTRLDGIFGEQVIIYKDHNGKRLNVDEKSTTTNEKNKETTKLLPSMDTSKLKEASMKLASKFYAAAVKDSQKNVLVSPYSLKVLFSMASLGFSKENEKKLARAMFLDTDRDYLTAVFDQFRALNLYKAEGIKINSANRIWLDESFELKDGYKSYVGQYTENFYDKVNFRYKSSEAQETMNNEIADLTNDKIKDLFNSIGSDTKVVLANALYFNAGWKDVFKKAESKHWKNYDKTSNEDGIKFHNSKTKDNVSMDDLGSIMRVKITIPYLTIKGSISKKRPTIQVASIPYKDERFSMVVILPLKEQRNSHTVTTADENFTRLEESIKENVNRLGNILQKLDNKESTYIEIVMPKFETNWDGDIMPMLEDLGMEVLKGVNFSQMSDTPLDISNIKQKTMIKVDINGTEAAAATSIDVRGKSLFEPPKIMLNRSFLYLIRDTETGAILFMGRFLSPS